MYEISLRMPQMELNSWIIKFNIFQRKLNKNKLKQKQKENIKI